MPRFDLEEMSLTYFQLLCFAVVSCNSNSTGVLAVDCTSKACWSLSYRVSWVSIYYVSMCTVYLDREGLPFLAFFCSFIVSEDFFFISWRDRLYSVNKQTNMWKFCVFFIMVRLIITEYRNRASLRHLWHDPCPVGWLFFSSPQCGPVEGLLGSPSKHWEREKIMFLMHRRGSRLH